MAGLLSALYAARLTFLNGRTVIEQSYRKKNKKIKEKKKNGEVNENTHNMKLNKSLNDKTLRI